jgi:hypothetical protein
MEPNGSLPYTQKTNSDPYSTFNETRPRHIILFPNINCCIILIYLFIYLFIYTLHGAQKISIFLTF